MSKSLTEVAKSILMKESTGIPEVHPNGAGDPFRDANSSNPNKASLKPNSKTVEGVFSNPGATGAAEFQKKQDLGPAVTKNTDVPGSAKAVVGGKDTSKAAKSSVAGEASKKLSMAEEMEDEGDLVAEEEINEEETLDENVEMSEELEAFVDAMIAEGASEDEILAAIQENFEIVEETLDEEVEAIAEEEYQVDMAEDIEALFAGEELSEEFKAKAKTIFEAAVKAKIAEEIKALEEAYAATLAEEVEGIEEELSSNVDDYLNYVVEQWTAENEVAIEAGLRAELTEDFISGLRNLFAEHYIDIPADKVNVVEELGAKVEELEAKLNEEIDRNVSLNKMLNESKTNEILISACDGLTDTQAEKLKTLAEGIEYATSEEYAQKVSILRENYFSTAVKTDKVLDSVESAEDGKSMIAEELSGPMAKYVNALGRTLPR